MKLPSPPNSKFFNAEHASLAAVASVNLKNEIIIVFVVFAFYRTIPDYGMCGPIVIFDLFDIAEFAKFLLKQFTVCPRTQPSNNQTQCLLRLSIP
jgi:hypothetical protein